MRGMGLASSARALLKPRCKFAALCIKIHRREGEGFGGEELVFGMRDEAITADMDRPSTVRYFEPQDAGHVTYHDGGWDCWVEESGRGGIHNW